jgi:hypothetical protein
MSVLCMWDGNDLLMNVERSLSRSILYQEKNEGKSDGALESVFRRSVIRHRDNLCGRATLWPHV